MWLNLVLFIFFFSFRFSLCTRARDECLGAWLCIYVAVGPGNSAMQTKHNQNLIYVRIQENKVSLLLINKTKKKSFGSLGQTAGFSVFLFILNLHTNTERVGRIRSLPVPPSNPVFPNSPPC